MITFLTFIFADGWRAFWFIVFVAISFGHIGHTAGRLYGKWLKHRRKINAPNAEKA